MKPSSQFYRWQRSKLRAIFNALCASALLLLFFRQCAGNCGGDFQEATMIFPQNWSFKGTLIGVASRGGVFRRRIAETDRNSSKCSQMDDRSVDNHSNFTRKPAVCTGLDKHEGYKTKCEYVRANPQCSHGGFFNYLRFFYCDCSNLRGLGFVVLGIWLVALFYLLGNTAADFFCCCLAKLSSLLRLPPTVAGVTLLPLGNGAPDFFASIAAFVGSDSGAVGFNSVLGGAVFVTSVVAGTVSLCVAELGFQIDKKCFIRDVCFFLIAIAALLLILIVGEVSIGGAVAFVLIYVAYGSWVVTGEILRKYTMMLKLDVLKSLIPSGTQVGCHGNGDDGSMNASLLEAGQGSDLVDLPPDLSDWSWTKDVAIYSNDGGKPVTEDIMVPEWGWNEEDRVQNPFSLFWWKLFVLLEIPLMLPRRLTIPIIEEDRWSKGLAVASATLAPLLLAFLYNTQNNVGSLIRIVVYLIASVFGGILGTLAFAHTKAEHPPQRFLFPWVFGGFFMSIIWFYIIANELVVLLVELGLIFGISPSVLGLTVLAWGNSMGDLMSNAALATNGAGGVQIAMSGCFAGPMFNTLAGLGVSMLLGAWARKPAPYIVPREASLFHTLGFLVMALVWSLIVLPCSNMRPSKTLGIGLMSIYLIFLTSKMIITVSNGPFNNIN